MLGAACVALAGIILFLFCALQAHDGTPGWEIPATIGLVVFGLGLAKAIWS